MLTTIPNAIPLYLAPGINLKTIQYIPYSGVPLLATASHILPLALPVFP
jgi:hypothetical protein